REFDVTRRRLDTTRDDWGQFLYLRDTASGDAWSPARADPDRRQSRLAVTFHPDRGEIRSAEAGIETVVDIMVAPEDDVQIHRFTLTNQTLRTRVIELTSYCELALAAHNADRAHPAFSKLFVETEVIEERKTLLASRRLRSPGEAPVWCGQTL